MSFVKVHLKKLNVGFFNDTGQNLTFNVACAKMPIRKAFEEVKIDIKITKLTRCPEWKINVIDAKRPKENGMHFTNVISKSISWMKIYSFEII